jgi:MFS transporter, ACS family, tartrate transporter
LLLGAAEAGWWPGLLYFMCCWFPRSFRARAATWLFLASPCSAVLGFPLSGLLLSLPAYLGLASWQWLFIIEGAPAILVGIIALLMLRSEPREAEWLSAAEQDTLVQTLAAEAPIVVGERKPGLRRAFSHPTVMFFCFMNFLFAINLYGVYFWIPSLVKGLGSLSYNEVGLVSAIPFVFGAIGMLLCAVSSDRLGDRKWHIATLFIISGLAMFCAAVTNSPAIKIGWISLAVFGSFGQSGTLYAFATESFGRLSSDPKMLATRIAAVIMSGSLGGFVAPYVIGLLLERFGDFSYALMIIGALLVLAGLAMAAARRALLQLNHPPPLLA